MKWTDRQMLAIKEKDKDILVSASAGSGKTAVLSERIIDIIVNEKIDIDKFVVVTFTKLAAGEMRQRIIKKLEKLKENEDIDKRFLERQIILAEKANISTLHSFGLSLIKEYFYLLNLSPNVEMIDDVDASMKKEEILEELLDEYYESKDETFIKLNKMYSSYKDDVELRSLINKYANFALNMTQPYKAIDNSIALYTGNEDIKKTYYEDIKEEIILMLNEHKNSLIDYRNEFEAIDNDISVINNIISSLNESYEKVTSYLSNISFNTLRFPKDYDVDEKETIKGKREEMKKYVKSLSTRYFKQSKEELEASLTEMSECIIMLATITKEYLKRYSNYKISVNKIDFNDIEHLTLKLLIDNNGNLTEICKEIRETYRYVIVDEYQDINAVQETILQCISTYESKVPNMFMVGDIKQSIYRFRKADPEIFAHKYNTFSKDSDSKEYKIDLNQNFRSRKEVLYSINDIFEKIMKKSIGSIEYDEEMKLVYGDLYKEDIKQDYKTKQYLIIEDDVNGANGVETSSDKPNNNKEKNDESNDLVDEELEDIEKYEKEALVIIKTINEMMENKYQVYDLKIEDDNKYRDIRYSDFTILLRSMGRDSYAIYKKILESGIPVTFGKDENILERLEVLILINVLKIIDNPYDDIPLVSTLYTQAFNFTPSDLKDIKDNFKTEKKSYKNVTFFEKLMSYKLDDDEKENCSLKDDVKKKIENFRTYYEKWQDSLKEKSLVNLIDEVTCDMNYLENAIYKDESIKYIDSIKKFKIIVQNYEEKESSLLSDFIRYLNYVIENKIELEIKLESKVTDTVSMTTIHKSKGLEYPVVFMPTLGKQFNTSDNKERVILDKKYGLISSYVNTEKYYTSSNFYKETAIAKITKENLAEEMRVLYVAMTRAKEKLIMIGTLKDKSKYEKYEKISKNKNYYNSILSSKNFLDMIIPSEIASPKTIDIELITNMDLYKIKKVENPFNIKDLEIGGESNTSLDYRFQDVTNINEKVSVTQLKQLELDSKLNDDNVNVDDEHSDKNSTLTYNQKVRLIKEKLTGAEKGTIYHKIVKIVDNSKSIGEYFDEFIAKGVFSKDELKEIDKTKIEKYMNSNLFQRISSSSYVKKELPFMMKKKVNDVYKDVVTYDENDYVIIQGIIDCIFEEDEKIVILDYKTDKVKCETEEEKMARIEELRLNYKKQLDLYEEAVKLITGKEIKEKILYLFDIDEVVKI